MAYGGSGCSGSGILGVENRGLRIKTRELRDESETRGFTNIFQFGRAEASLHFGLVWGIGRDGEGGKGGERRKRKTMRFSTAKIHKRIHLTRTPATYNHRENGGACRPLLNSADAAVWKLILNVEGVNGLGGWHDERD